MPAPASIAWPGVSRLFQDYLSDFERVARFYPAGRPLDLIGLERLAAARLNAYPAEHRRRMTGILESQNPASPAVADHLLRFAQSDCVAVVTGQQVGVFGGPLLALLKAMTAVKLAEALRAAGRNAVSIFWMATQDHDRDEVDHVVVLDRAGRPQTIAVPLEGAAGAPCGELSLGTGVEAALDQFALACGGDADLTVLRETYLPGAKLGEAFARLLARWFAPWGLLVFDPMHQSAAQLWASCYSPAFERQSELAGLLAARAQQLEVAGYHAQVEQTAAASMLYLHRDGVRQGLRQKNGKYLLGEREISAAEIEAWLRDQPGAVSASALLRPVLQDVAFPTVAQITGPAETAYLAQSAVLYEALGVQQPIAWPRASATIVDAKAQRILAKYQLRAEAVWQEDVAVLLARKALPPGIEQRVAAMRASFESEFARLTAELGTLDPTLVEAAGGARAKILHQLEQLDGRVARSFARRNDELAAQAQHLAGLLHPNRHLQERELAAAYFTARNPALTQLLHDTLDITTGSHQFIAI